MNKDHTWNLTNQQHKKNIWNHFEKGTLSRWVLHSVSFPVWCKRGENIFPTNTFQIELKSFTRHVLFYMHTYEVGLAICQLFYHFPLFFFLYCSINVQIHHCTSTFTSSSFIAIWPRNLKTLCVLSLLALKITIAIISCYKRLNSLSQWVLDHILIKLVQFLVLNWLKTLQTLSSFFLLLFLVSRMINRLCLCLRQSTWFKLF